MCLHDRTSKMLISVGEHKDGLYFFGGKLWRRAYAFNGVGLVKLWHVRLGHPSLKITKLVLTIDLKTSGDVMNKNCDVVHRAKYTGDSFSLNENKTPDVLELTHCVYRDPAKLGLLVVDTIS